jgi:hypothetical protein
MTNKYIQALRSIQINKYIQTYIKICERSLIRATTKKSANKLLGYVEAHHILPKAFKLGGEKDTMNYVYLTAREHFICHKLLVRGLRHTEFYYRCLNATKKFIQANSMQKRVLTSRDYQFVRGCLSESMKGSNNPMFGKIGNLHPRFGKIHDEETKKVIKEKRKKQQISHAMLLALKNGRNDSTGIPHTEEELVKMRKAQSGRAWVHNESERRRVKKEELQQYIENGFRLGKGISN